MARDVKPTSGSSPVTKEEFGRRVYRAMSAKGWRQSDLGKHAGLGRDSISNYVAGKAFPTATSLDRLANALGVDPYELMPGHHATSRLVEKSTFYVEDDPNDRRFVFMRLDKRVLFSTALKIGEILKDDADAAEADAADAG